MRKSPQDAQNHYPYDGESKTKVKIHEQARSCVMVYARHQNTDQEFNAYKKNDKPVEPFCGGSIGAGHAAILHD